MRTTVPGQAQGGAVSSLQGRAQIPVVTTRVTVRRWALPAQPKCLQRGRVFRTSVWEDPGRGPGGGGLRPSEGCWELAPALQGELAPALQGTGTHVPWPAASGRAPRGPCSALVTTPCTRDNCLHRVSRSRCLCPGVPWLRLQGSAPPPLTFGVPAGGRAGTGEARPSVHSEAVGAFG